MRFLSLMDAGRVNEVRRIPRESMATGRSGEAHPRVGGPRTFSPAAPVRFSAHRMSVVDGPFPETKQ
jgi:hypothetical protein